MGADMEGLMAVQTTVQFRSDKPVRPGMRLGHGDEISRLAGALTPKIVDVTITAANSTSYSLPVGGKTQTHALAFNSDADATTVEVRDGLIADADAKPDLVERVEVYDNGADKVRIEGRLPNDDFPVDDTDGNLAASVVQAAGAGVDIGFGLLVCAGPKEGTCDLPARSGGGALVTRLLGVSLISAREALLPDQDTEVHRGLQVVPIRRVGEATVQVKKGINPVPGDEVHVYTSDTADAKRGQATNAADGTSTVQLSDVRWTEGYRGTWGKYTVATLYITDSAA